MFRSTKNNYKIFSISKYSVVFETLYICNVPDY